MPATPVASYLVGTINLNCRGGGYQHTYEMLANTFSQAAIDLQMILKALMMVLEGGTAVYDAVISSVGGVADGYELAKNTTFAPQLLIQSGTLGTETTAPGMASDPSKGIRWGLDTGAGYRPTRLLRSIRGGWINNNLLVQGVSAPSNSGAAIAVGTSPVTFLSYYQVGTAPYNAADALSNYFSIVRDKTALYVKNPAGPPAYLQYGFLAANGTPGNPDWQVLGISQKKIGKGFPRVRGRQKAYA